MCTSGVAETAASKTAAFAKESAVKLLLFLWSEGGREKAKAVRLVSSVS